jgi:GntR family transcriptional regulator, transcriptional repressor for pyruvate dehydrogenase complex
MSKVAAATKKNAARKHIQVQKRADLVAEEIKRWIAERNLQPGDKFPKESELQETFGVSKGTMREALKSLEVQGLVTVNTGPGGGARLGEVRLDRTFQLLQNYLFFKDVSINDIYAMRRIVEPELAAGAVVHLTEAQIVALEHSVDQCSPLPANRAHAIVQRQEDLHFHDILAQANPNPLLGLICQIINQMLRHLVVLGPDPSGKNYQRLGDTNVAAHRKILSAVRKRDAKAVRRLMLEHIVEAEQHVLRLHADVSKRLVLDSDFRINVFPHIAGSN